MKPNYRNIVQKGDEIYLCVNGEWFFITRQSHPWAPVLWALFIWDGLVRLRREWQLSAWWINMPMYQAFVKEPN